MALGQSPALLTSLPSDGYEEAWSRGAAGLTAASHILSCD